MNWLDFEVKSQRWRSWPDQIWSKKMGGICTDSCV